MNTIPKDPFMLYSFVNMKLRDEYDTLEELCAAFDVEAAAIKDKLAAAGFEYDEESKQFG